jgi:hypothetical protein
MEQVDDDAHIPLMSELKARPKGVNWGYKATVWFTEHEFYKYARKPTDPDLYGIDTVLEVLPHAPKFHETYNNADFFDIWEHDKTGATYNPSTKEVVFWTTSSKIGKIQHITATPHDVYTHYFGDYEEKQSVYYQGYSAQHYFNSEPKKYLFYSSSIVNSNYAYREKYAFTNEKDPSITYYIINGGILKPTVEYNDEVLVVPPPPRPVPEIIDLTHVPDEPSTGSPVESLPVTTKIERSTRGESNVPVQVEEDSKPSSKRKYESEDDSDSDESYWV